MARVKVNLTEREALELVTLVNIVLTNADQWDVIDLSALRRAAQKIEEASS